ncbi:type II toxin-antitoxin system prevent-host-death family antitoxin [Nocardia sp. NEAU-G5]|uniref:Type II toxin-antitoxin system prevent-host-death family antitoxin n=1 Tax=Nocardia albiluteola TaxID=2842303 RepID=A0ABS6BCD5_9NOCA|nr:type II toxin-antitoxin system prevent-host-death family antitoxin [Nocardia albiluteola]MBU3067411.1 type II toxin-antitoxin system prevent-host-death family antitoxin [Nocardia albiluteola]
MTKTITQAELRNGSAGIMDALEAGDDFIITRNGRPVGELRPITPRRSITTTELKARMARFAGLPSGAQHRAEIDEMFGEDRLDD